jgi:hypothetical protein
MGRWLSRCCGLAPTAVPGVRPGGRPTFLCAQESRQRKRPCKTGPAGSPAMLASPGPRRTPCVRCAHSGQTAARSQFSRRAARAPGLAALLGGLEGESRNSQLQQPTAQPESPLAPAVLYAPFSAAEERKTRSPRAQLASSTDSRRLFEQSVAARVRRGASGLSTAGNPERSEGRRGRGELFAYFLAVQKVGRPPGRNPGMGLGVNPKQRQHP